MEAITFEMDMNCDHPQVTDGLIILYALSGETTVFTVKNSIKLTSEDFVVISPFVQYEVQPKEASHVLYITIPAEILAQAEISAIACYSRAAAAQADYLSLIRSQLARLYLDFSDTDSDRKIHILSEVFGLLATLKQQFSDESGITTVDAKGNDTIHRILSYTLKNFTRDITIQDVADELYLSRGYLSRIFPKYMGVPFSEYLRGLRLSKAAKMLLSTDMQVTQIAYECGFSNPNTFTLNFRECYHETPNVFRRKEREQTAKPTEAPETAPLMNLLKYANREDGLLTLNKKPRSPIPIDIQTQGNVQPLYLSHQDSVSVGFAETLLREDMRESVRRAVKEVGFHFLNILGIFDDSIDVYHEREDGSPYLNFTYLDMVLDFVLSTKAKPCIIFGYTPALLASSVYYPFGNSIMSIPKDMNRWIFLVNAVMEHWVDRYGLEEISQWRYSMYPAAMVSFGTVEIEEFDKLYLCTYQAVRSWIPDACILGCQLDLDILHFQGSEKMDIFLNFCIQNHCMPDILTLQCFHRNYTAISPEKSSARINAKPEYMASEPAPNHEDPNYLHGAILELRQKLDQRGLSHLPIQIIMWNSTIWQRDLVNDTCFKSAFLIKNYLENAEHALMLSVSALTDSNESRTLNSSNFHGGFGLFSFNGLPKAAYYALTLLNRMQGALLAKGNGYLVTCGRNRKQIQIMLYHYCHHDAKNHIDVVLSSEDQRTVDRYYSLENPGTQSYWLRILGLEEGKYSKETYYINRSAGSSYDRWQSIGAPEIMTKKQWDYLEKTVSPGYNFETVHVAKNKALLVSAVLDTHEVRLICLEKK